MELRHHFSRQVSAIGRKLPLAIRARSEAWK
jgi:hypothetical protein